MGHWYDRIVNGVEHPLDTVHGWTNTLGITNPPPPDLTNTPDAKAQREFATQLRAQYGGIQPGTAQQVQPTALDQTQSNQARDAANGNLAGLQSVANGGPTAADALLRQGTDAAQSQAMGLAAAYSRQNPGAALRQGLAAGQSAQAQATSVAAQQKAQEQAQARGQLGTFADAMRGQDLSAATANQQNTADAQKSNQAADLQQQSVNNQFQLGLGNLASSATASPVAAQQQNLQNQLANQQSNQSGVGGLLTAIGSKTSDRASKKDIKPASFADALAKNVHSVTYQYKPGQADESKHEGLIADDLEKVFPSAVKKGADGLRRVDTAHLSMATTGVVAELAKRLKALEARR